MSLPISAGSVHTRFDNTKHANPGPIIINAGFSDALLQAQTPDPSKQRIPGGAEIDCLSSIAFWCVWKRAHSKLGGRGLIQVQDSCTRAVTPRA